MKYEQLDLFELPTFKFSKKLRIIETFAGIGSQYMALRDLEKEGFFPKGIESYKVIEFDKQAIASYNAIHGTNYSTSDIREIKGSDLEIKDKDNYQYLLTYSFPCQDLSNAGHKKGMKKGSSTRSGLLWEVERLLNETEALPDVLLMENVSQVINDKNRPDFEEWLSFLRSKGYSNSFKVLNARDYEIPQNRERCFMISILGDYIYNFPEPKELKLKAHDFLEEVVEEKFYLNKELSDSLIKNTKDLESKISNAVNFAQLMKKGKDGNWIKRNNGSICNINADYSGCLLSRYYKGAIGDRDPLVLTVQLHKNSYDTKELQSIKDGTLYNIDSDYLGTIVARYYKDIGGAGDNMILEGKNNSLRLRRLIPLETWRFMGFSDEDFYKAQKVSSNSALYKQAGNSIVKNVLKEIFKKLV